MIFTPCQSGALSVPTATSMVDAAFLLTSAGIDYQWRIQQGGCFIHVIRERAARLFLASDCTDLLFLDDDIGFDAAGLLRMLAHPVEVVGAVCVKRGTGEPVVKPSAQAGDLIACDYVGTGLLRVTRAALERFGGDRIFDAHYVGDRFVGEDVAFCAAYRARGGAVYADPAIATTHTGPHTWAYPEAA